MQPDYSRWGMGTLVNHSLPGEAAWNAHVPPIFQTSTFSFEDVQHGAGIIAGQQPGYYYTRLGNPNQTRLARAITVLEALDLLRAQPDRSVEEIACGQVFASGMAAVSAAILSRVRAGDTLIAQADLYGNTYNLLDELAPRYGIEVAWVQETGIGEWEQVFAAHPRAVLAYAETPANPVLQVIDIKAVAELAHRHDCWLVVDNTFATPYCQRPLSLGADIVVHSTTKYLSGHGVVIGGALVARHPEYMKNDLPSWVKLLGGVASPFDCWLTELGLRTFELRMQRHCENARAAARLLESHPAVAKVHYPGLESHPGHEIARRQMLDYGAMLSFELRGGYQSGVTLLENVRLATLAVSLGNVDTLISHPASMTHSDMPPEARRRSGIRDGLVRLSVGIENTADLIADLETALSRVN